MVQHTPLPSSLQALARLLPFISAFVFILGSVLVLPLPYVGTIAPLMGLMAIYYWAIYRPDLLRPFPIFLLGLLNDALHMFPFGFSAALFLALYQLVFTQRRFFVGQTFLVIWVGFALVALLSVAAQWAALSLDRGQALSLQPIAIEYGLTLVLFPFHAWLLMHLQRVFLNQE